MLNHTNICDQHFPQTFTQAKMLIPGKLADHYQSSNFMTPSKALYEKGSSTGLQLSWARQAILLVLQLSVDFSSTYTESGELMDGSWSK